MTKNDFKKQLKCYLTENYRGEFDAGLTYTSINNEAGHECLALRSIAEGYTVTIGVESLLSIFRNLDGSMEGLAERIVSYYDAFTDAAKCASTGHYNALLNNVYCRLINYSMNRRRISEMPHERRLDMAVVYYLRIRLADTENAGVLIDYSKFASAENEAQIRQSAWENTLRDEPPAVCLLSDILGTEPCTDVPVYVISNADRFYGSICLYYPGFLRGLAQELGDDFYILPSSVHECLVVPADGSMDTMRLRDMVHQVNRTELERHEILSDSVYFYHAKKDRLSIDN